ncbi:hypothetical protein AB0J84_31470 [Micromonospora arborensis]|uniref:hypothetical protein n=1 Tax=Micromonospora arborensis TaxID=2116518 RepID=UPI00342ACD41
MTPAGDLLETDPHPLGITRPDGSRLTLREAVDQAAERVPPSGHRVHQAPARPGRVAAPGYGCHRQPAVQLALFTTAA